MIWLGIKLKYMKLHLIRHAKTDPTSTTGKDFDRKLLTKGIIQANVLGCHLKEKLVRPFETFCSSAIRTKETLTILQSILDLGKIHLLDDLYLSDREMYLKTIWELKHVKDVLFIGHNDGISEFASYLLDEDLSMKTSGYLCIEFSAKSWEEVSQGTGKLLSEYRPAVYFPE